MIKSLTDFYFCQENLCTSQRKLLFSLVHPTFGIQRRVTVGIQNFLIDQKQRVVMHVVSETGGEYAVVIQGIQYQSHYFRWRFTVYSRLE